MYISAVYSDRWHTDLWSVRGEAVQRGIVVVMVIVMLDRQTERVVSRVGRGQRETDGHLEIE